MSGERYGAECAVCGWEGAERRSSLDALDDFDAHARSVQHARHRAAQAPTSPDGCVCGPTFDGDCRAEGCTDDCQVCAEPIPTCDICGKPDGPGAPDWNGETGCHRSCEPEAVPIGA